MPNAIRELEEWKRIEGPPVALRYYCLFKPGPLFGVTETPRPAAIPLSTNWAVEGQLFVVWGEPIELAQLPGFPWEQPPIDKLEEYTFVQLVKKSSKRPDPDRRGGTENIPFEPPGPIHRGYAVDTIESVYANKQADYSVQCPAGEPLEPLVGDPLQPAPGELMKFPAGEHGKFMIDTPGLLLPTDVVSRPGHYEYRARFHTWLHGVMLKPDGTKTRFLKGVFVHSFLRKFELRGITLPQRRVGNVIKVDWVRAAEYAGAGLEYLVWYRPLLDDPNLRGDGTLRDDGTEYPWYWPKPE